MIAPDPKAGNTPDRPTLHEGDVGQVGAAMMALTRELWVLSDRFAVLEAVLARRGIDVTAEIEGFQPDAEMQARLDARGKQLVSSVVNVLAGIADLPR
jgi:hypothetical protein